MTKVLVRLPIITCPLQHIPLNMPAWSATLHHYTGYNAHDLLPCTQLVHRLFLDAKRTQLPAIRDKYSSPRFFAVAKLTPPECLPEHCFRQAY